jgi:hypothetical protein
VLSPAAVTLASGEVLVVGGDGPNFVPTASAEIYDEATGTWSAAAPMNVPGYNLRATLLRSGKVLVTGQGSGANPELFDPQDGRWTDTGPTVASQPLASAVLLQSGGVLLVGGGVATAQLYDPATNTWKATGSLQVARQGQSATLLPDGEVLVAGGEPPGGGTPFSSVEIYDPVTGKFSSGSPMNEGRTGQGAALLPGGQVIVFGGCSGYCNPGTLRSTEIYDIADGFWFDSLPMTVPRESASSVVLPGGSLLVTGGSEQGCCLTTATSEIYRIPSLSLSVAAGAPGSKVVVRGFGFDGGEAVGLHWGASNSGPTVTTSATGTFIATLTVPSRQPGSTQLNAVGQRSNGRAAAAFTITS